MTINLSENHLEPILSTPRGRDAWASFVWELRRHGYWGYPERFDGYFIGFYSDYLRGDAQDHYWEDNHCCDNLDFEKDGHSWIEWTDEDRKKVESEYEKLKTK